MSREEIRFLADVAARPLSPTVSRYQRLNLSRRKGNAIRQQLAAAGLITATSIATRSGQVVLYQLTDHGRALCVDLGIDAGAVLRASLEHQFWVDRAAAYYEDRGYELVQEYPVPGDGIVDLLAEKPGERVAIEIETGKSDIRENLTKLGGAGFDQIVLLAASPHAVGPCQKAINQRSADQKPPVQLLTWLDVS